MIKEIIAGLIGATTIGLLIGVARAKPAEGLVGPVTVYEGNQNTADIATTPSLIYQYTFGPDDHSDLLFISVNFEKYATAPRGTIWGYVEVGGYYYPQSGGKMLGVADPYLTYTKTHGTDWHWLIPGDVAGHTMSFYLWHSAQINAGDYSFHAYLERFKG